MADVITHVKCAHKLIQVEEKALREKMSINDFKKILNDIVPKYGTPQINLEGSGEPTMAKDLPSYIQAVKEKKFKMFHVL